jgi:hypothetical protein
VIKLSNKLPTQGIETELTDICFDYFKNPVKKTKKEES